ncbi:MAG: zinc-dependent alcohol dehydrogenase family protein [Gemmataceae bacterium]
MRALRFERFGEPADVLHVATVPVADPHKNQVRVRMRLAPVNPSDLMVVRGRYGKLPTLPATPGFEGMGVVEHSGGGMLPWLRGLKPGRRVAVVSGEGGTWQESIVVSARNVIPLPDAIPDEQGASFFVNPVTALVLTRHVLRLRPGSVLLQTAAGSSLGRMIDRLSRHQGFRVINVVRRRDQANELEAGGAWKVICTEDESMVESAMAYSGGHGVDCAIDCVGGRTSFDALRCVAPGGKLVVYGTLSGEPVPLEPRELMTHGKSVEGFWLGPWVHGQGPLTMLRLFRQVKRLIQANVLTSPAGTTFPLDRFADAMREADRPGRPGKTLLRLE